MHWVQQKNELVYLEQTFSGVEYFASFARVKQTKLLRQIDITFVRYLRFTMSTIVRDIGR